MVDNGHVSFDSKQNMDYNDEDEIDVKVQNSTIDLPAHLSALEDQSIDSSRMSISEPWTEKLNKYIGSSKGQVLTRTISAVYTMLISVIAIAIILSNELSTIGYQSINISMFFAIMFGLSTVSIITLLIFSCMDKLTNDHHFKMHAHGGLFLKAGAIALGTGSLIYDVVQFVDYSTLDEYCKLPIDFISNFLEIAFVILEIILILNFSKAHINKNNWISVLGRFFTMQVIATNICVWVHTVVFETVEEIHKYHESDDHHEDHFNKLADDKPLGNETYCPLLGDISEMVAPFLFPLKIEYSVVAATLVLAIWEKCGLGHSEHSQKHHITPMMDRFNSVTEDKKRRQSVISTASFNIFGSQDHLATKYYNNHLGFIIGYVVICSSIAGIIVYLVLVNDSDTNTLLLESISYSYDMLIKLLCFITTIFTIYKMSALTTKDDEIKKLRGLREHRHLKIGTSIHRALDMNLLTITFFAALLFQTFTIIAAVENDSPYILTNAIVSVLMITLQSIFINWYGFQKRATKEKDHIERPGRQGLEILRCCNLALWATGTFIVKHPEAKRIHINTFGFEAWVILSNLTQPLNILYHFHSVACLAEIIEHAYTSKYVGLRRASKFNKWLAIFQASMKPEDGNSPPGSHNEAYSGDKDDNFNSNYSNSNESGVCVEMESSHGSVNGDSNDSSTIL